MIRSSKLIIITILIIISPYLTINIYNLIYDKKIFNIGEYQIQCSEIKTNVLFSKIDIKDITIKSNNHILANINSTNIKVNIIKSIIMQNVIIEKLHINTIKLTTKIKNNILGNEILQTKNQNKIFVKNISIKKLDISEIIDLEDHQIFIDLNSKINQKAITSKMNLMVINKKDEVVLMPINTIIDLQNNYKLNIVSNNLPINLISKQFTNPAKLNLIINNKKILGSIAQESLGVCNLEGSIESKLIEIKMQDFKLNQNNKPSSINFKYTDDIADIIIKNIDCKYIDIINSLNFSGLITEAKATYQNQLLNINGHIPKLIYAKNNIKHTSGLDFNFNANKSHKNNLILDLTPYQLETNDIIFKWPDKTHIFFNKNNINDSFIIINNKKFHFTNSNNDIKLDINQEDFYNYKDNIYSKHPHNKYFNTLNEIWLKSINLNIKSSGMTLKIPEMKVKINNELISFVNNQINVSHNNYFIDSNIEHMFTDANLKISHNSNNNYANVNLQAKCNAKILEIFNNSITNIKGKFDFSIESKLDTQSLNILEPKITCNIDHISYFDNTIHQVQGSILLNDNIIQSKNGKFQFFNDIGIWSIGGNLNDPKFQFSLPINLEYQSNKINASISGNSNILSKKINIKVNEPNIKIKDIPDNFHNDFLNKNNYNINYDIENNYLHLTNNKNLHSYIIWDDNNIPSIKITLNKEIENPLLDKSKIMYNTIYFDAHLDQLEASAWQDFLEQEDQVNYKYLPKKYHLNFNISNLDYYGYNILKSNINVINNTDSNINSNSWEIFINSDNVNGLINIIDNNYKLNFDKIDFSKETSQSKESKIDFLKDYNIEANINNLSIDSLKNMSLHLQTITSDHSLNLKLLEIYNSNSKLTANGQWLFGNHLTKPSSSISIDIVGKNIASLANLITRDRNIDNTDGTINSFLTWTGSPDSFAIAKADGVINLRLMDGILLNFENKLIKTINSIFQEDKQKDKYGTQFKLINGKIKFNKSYATIQPTTIILPVTNHELYGTINLLNYKININHKGSIFILEAANKIFMLDKILPTQTEIYHSITGTISEPIVTKINNQK